MEIFIKVVQFFLSLSILVIIHELGHFFFAKVFKTRVEKFYLFFNLGFSIFKFKKGDTEYGVGWLPLGGYVKISGMIDESMDKEQMAKPPQPYEFRSKPSLQRLLIMIGGVMFNILLAMLIYISVLFAWGKEYLPVKNATYGITCDSLALNIGLKNGDKILSINHKEIEDFGDIFTGLILNNARTVQIDRNGEQIDIQLPDSIVRTLLERGKEGRNFISIRIPFIIDKFKKGSPGEMSGLKKEDKIIGLNGNKIEYFDQFKDSLANYKQQEVTISVLRGADTIAIKATVPETGLLGIQPVFDLTRFFEVKKFQYTFLQSIPEGIKEGANEIGNYFKQLKLIFNPQTKAYESVGGFLSIGSIFPGVWSWEAFWHLTALLSIMLGILNLLPIPALDGGHVMFLLFEIITGKKPSDKFMEYAQIVGMVILLALVLLANGNDVIRFFFK